MGLAPPRGLANPLFQPLYHACCPGHQRAMLTWRHPHLPPRSAGQSRLTLVTDDEGCVRYPT